MNKSIAKPSNKEHIDAPPQEVSGAYANLTEEQKKWPRVRLAPTGRLVRVEDPDPPPPSPPELLAAVAEMLSSGFAGSAEAIFRHMYNAGVTLKTEIGEDGVLHVTAVRA